MRFVLDAQPLAIKTIHALRYINVLTKNSVFINESMIFSILEYHRMYLFLKLVQFIKKRHGQRVMNYPGTTKAPIMLGPPRLRSSAHQYVHRLICRGLGPSLLHGGSVLLLLLLSGRFHPFHGQCALPLRRRIQNQANLLHQRFVLIKSLMLLILLLKHTREK